MLFALFAIGILSQNVFSQTVLKKECSKCGKEVSVKSKVGDKCPYCSTIWGSENTLVKKTESTGAESKSKTRSYISKKKSKKQAIYYSDSNEKLYNEFTDTSDASKDETEKWILDKIQKNKDVESHVYQGDNGVFYYSLQYIYTNIYFSDTYLVVEYQTIYKNNVNRPWEKGEIITNNHIEKIPIYYIKYVSCEYSYSNLQIVTSGKDIIYEGSSIYFKNEPKVTKYSNSTTIRFIRNSEEDFNLRMMKAFKHLKKFYNYEPRITKVKETF